MDNQLGDLSAVGTWHLQQHCNIDQLVLQFGHLHDLPHFYGNSRTRRYALFILALRIPELDKVT